LEKWQEKLQHSKAANSNAKLPYFFHDYKAAYKAATKIIRPSYKA